MDAISIAFALEIIRAVSNGMERTFPNFVNMPPVFSASSEPWNAIFIFAMLEHRTSIGVSLISPKSSQTLSPSDNDFMAFPAMASAFALVIIDAISNGANNAPETDFSMPPIPFLPSGLPWNAIFILSTLTHSIVSFVSSISKFIHFLSADASTSIAFDADCIAFPPIDINGATTGSPNAANSPPTMPIVPAIFPTSDHSIPFMESVKTPSDSPKTESDFAATAIAPDPRPIGIESTPIAANSPPTIPMVAAIIPTSFHSTPFIDSTKNPRPKPNPASPTDMASAAADPSAISAAASPITPNSIPNVPINAGPNQRSFAEFSLIGSVRNFKPNPNAAIPMDMTTTPPAPFNISGNL